MTVKPQKFTYLTHQRFQKGALVAEIPGSSLLSRQPQTYASHVWPRSATFRFPG